MIKTPDIQLLLLPISDELPCGENYAFSPEFDAILKAREYDDPHLAQGAWSSPLKVADWDRVIESSEQLLKFNTKDIQVTTWLMEGWAHKFGYSGLTQGCDLLRSLCERYWENLHPLAEGGNQELRIGALIHFVTNLALLIRQIPITDAAGKLYTCVDYENAHRFEMMASKDPDIRNDIPEHKVTLTKLSIAQQKTSNGFYVSLKNDFEQARLSWQQLAQVLDSKLDNEGPAFGPVLESFDFAGRVILHFTKETEVVLDITLPIRHHPSELTAGVDDTNITLDVSRDIATREQALQKLESVAEFFRKTEPHSPVAYLASKAVSWGNMPLHEWLRVVIKDGGSLSHIEDLLGIHATESK